jgi:hypothetical protein
MAKLNIEGYKKIIGLAVGNWQCGIVKETDEIYTFLFNLHSNQIHLVDIEQPDIFNLVTIYRNYEYPNGFKVEVDFHIHRSDGSFETFTAVNQKFIYAHQLITLNKFKETIESFLIIKQ